MSTHPKSDRIDEEASLWAARLDGGGMSEEDHEALSVWLKADAEHRKKLTTYRELSIGIDTNVDAQLAVALESVTTNRQRKRRYGIVATLGVAAAIVVVAFSVVDRGLAISTGIAERRMSTLEDGSRVDLNANTTLIVDFNGAERRVTLEGGEALFSVFKNKLQPFIVKTSKGLIRVTGTTFNVREMALEATEVTVLEGSVLVQPLDKNIASEMLTANDQATFGINSLVVTSLPDGSAQDAAAWREGQVIFDGTPLREAIEKFATYHSLTIAVDEKVKGLRLGGRYSLEDLEGLLESLKTVLPVTVSRRMVPTDNGWFESNGSKLEYSVNASEAFEEWSD